MEDFMKKIYLTKVLCAGMTAAMMLASVTACNKTEETTTEAEETEASETTAAASETDATEATEATEESSEETADEGSKFSLPEKFVFDDKFELEVIGYEYFDTGDKYDYDILNVYYDFTSLSDIHSLLQAPFRQPDRDRIQGFHDSGCFR